MRKRVLYLILIFMAFSFNSIEAKAESASDAVIAYFEALKEGDVKTIKQYVAGEFYEQNRDLLEKSTTYPEFLRKYYEGSEFEIIDTVQADKDVIVGARIYFSNGSTSVKKLRLRSFGDNTWKIVGEINN